MAHFQQTVTWVGLELDAGGVTRGGGVTRVGGVTRGGGMTKGCPRRRESRGGALLIGD